MLKPSPSPPSRFSAGTFEILDLDLGMAAAEMCESGPSIAMVLMLRLIL